MKFTVNEFLAKLPLAANEKWKEGVWFTRAFSKGDFELEFFGPRGRDYQTPHEKDEIYIIARGSGEFVKAGERITFTDGDVLFVEKGVEHHFENFSEDFATWVIFFK
ncbi:MAG TPA: cupin domain-containing protein [Pyrinomonadaceae bacterium]|jgi:mannose-6-phosphate isomerase-like protein (cupin superfamily)